MNCLFFTDSGQQIEDQIKSACMLPKYGVDLMKCELDRLILLTRNSVYPLPYFVPRRVNYLVYSFRHYDFYNLISIVKIYDHHQTYYKSIPNCAELNFEQIRNDEKIVTRKKLNFRYYIRL